MIDFKYRPDVDGLRAVAVSLVLLFHADLGFSGGFVGVDVFFVISGFLITGLILKEQDTGTFSLTHFWVRRIRRIVPAATAMIVTVLVAGFFLLLPGDYEDLGKSAIAQQLMVANVHFCRNTGYFDGPSDLKPLLHTWSLAVEEQFYLGYPFLLMSLHRFGRSVTFRTLAILGVCSLVVSEYSAEHSSSAAFFLLPGRAWEMLIGGLVCWLPRPTRVPSWLLSLVSWLSLGAILGAGWFYTSTTPFPGLTALIPCVATAALIHVNATRLSFPATILATRPFVFVGQISYSLYLWHWPILVAARLQIEGQEVDLPFRNAVASLLASFVLAIISWKCIETPIRQNRGRSTREVFAAAALALGLTLMLGSASVVTEGFKSRFAASEYPWLYLGSPHAVYEMTTEQLIENGPVLLGAQNEPGDDAIDVLVWGDSHAMASAPAFQRSATESGRRCAIISRSGTPPVFGIWQNRHGPDGNRKWADAVKEVIRQRRVEKVVLVAKWSYYLWGGTKTTVMAEGSRITTDEAAVHALASGLDRTVAWFADRGVEVYLLPQIPRQLNDPLRSYLKSAIAGDYPVYGISTDEYAAQQQPMTEVLSRLSDRRVTVLQIADNAIFSGKRSLIGDSVAPFYVDHDHLSPYGAVSVMLPALESCQLFTRSQNVPPRPARAVGKLTSEDHLASRSVE